MKNMDSFELLKKFLKIDSNNLNYKIFEKNKVKLSKLDEDFMRLILYQKTVSLYNCQLEPNKAFVNLKNLFKSKVVPINKKSDITEKKENIISLNTCEEDITKITKVGKL